MCCNETGNVDRSFTDLAYKFWEALDRDSPFLRCSACITVMHNVDILILVDSDTALLTVLEVPE